VKKGGGENHISSRF